MIRNLLFHVHELSDCDIIPREWPMTLWRRITPTIRLGFFADMATTDRRTEQDYSAHYGWAPSSTRDDDLQKVILD